MSSATEGPSCGAIQGNPDFYGLGIRIGVYLQWTSTWVNLFAEPQSAQQVYDINSNFVFAILVATMIASFANPPAIQPIETHIMLQFALGFFVTSLSTFGLRLHFFRSASIAELREQLLKATKAAREHLQKSSAVDSNKQLKITPEATPEDSFYLSLNEFSPLKRPYLSWSGVLWRVSIMCMIAAVNIWLWFASQPNYRLPGDTCDPPLIFIFSMPRLKGSIVGFHKTVSIIIAVIMFYLSSPLFSLTIDLLLFMIFVLYGRMLIGFSNSEAQQRAWLRLGRLSDSVFKMGVLRYIPILGPVLLAQSKMFDSIFYFLANNETSDIFRLMVYLGRGKDQEREGVRERAQAKDQDTRRQRTSDTLAKLFCCLWNTFTILSIAWFMLSIELTLKWNNVEGVNSINNTGQLIPFVIVCVSTAQVIKKVTLIWLGKKYDGWEEAELVVVMDATDFLRIRKIRRRRLNTNTTGAQA
ncbi:hypothetical protein Hte_003633 [Hypoxylon texense]